MRTVASQALKYLQKNLGTEPILLLGIIWAEGGQEILYSDQSIDGENYPYPTIIDIGSFDTALTVAGSSDSQEISVILDDIDGKLKQIFNTKDIHKRPVSVYHHFRELNLDYKFLVFQGEINSPITWDEGDRTLSFTILTHTEDGEVAFAMEDGDFPSIPEDALGNVWPLVFGQVCNIQTTKVRSPRKGYLTAGEGWHDFTIPTRLCQARYIRCPSTLLAEIQTGVEKYIDDSEYQKMDPLYLAYYSELGIGPPGMEEKERPVMKELIGPDPQCVESRFETICALIHRRDQEMAYEHDSITIRGGINFPQNSRVTLNVDGSFLYGRFTGNTFQIEGRKHIDYDDWNHDTCRSVAERGYSLVKTTVIKDWGPTLPFAPSWVHVPTETEKNWIETASRSEWMHSLVLETFSDCDAGATSWQWGPTGGSTASWAAFENMEKAEFLWKPAGTEVYLEAESETLHIVSLIPGTVDSVAAYKKLPSGRNMLMEVPASYYTVYETDYTGYEVVEIGLSKPLSTYTDEGWSDEIYVSFTSEVGPNPVDIIEWLLDKYTNLTYDATTFTAVKAALTNYPCNFSVKDRKNVLELVNDIAYQSRCAVFIRNSVMYIKYLSIEPTSVRTITESDILANSFKITLTETEDIVTKHEINWMASEASIEDTGEVNRKIILKHNVARYGIMEESQNYYTQNVYDTILKSATFWLIRRSHTWKYVEFDAPLQHLDLDLFDCITIDVAQFSATPIKAVIEAATYNPANNTIHIKCWTPVLAGTDAVYLWAWPAGQGALRRFPLREEEADAGAGYSFTVTPPIDHILRSGYQEVGDGRVVILSSGDQNPSDIDDTAPEIVCEIADTVLYDVDEPDPVFEALKLGRSARTGISELQQSVGGNLDSGIPADPLGECEPEEAYLRGPRPNCVYIVYVWYIKPTLVSRRKPRTSEFYPCDGGPCERSGCGKPCDGPLEKYCFVFSTEYEARVFIGNIKENIEQRAAACGFCVGGFYPLLISGVKASTTDPSNPCVLEYASSGYSQGEPIPDALLYKSVPTA